MYCEFCSPRSPSFSLSPFLTPFTHCDVFAIQPAGAKHCDVPRSCGGIPDVDSGHSTWSQCRRRQIGGPRSYDPIQLHRQPNQGPWHFSSRSLPGSLLTGAVQFWVVPWFGLAAFIITFLFLPDTTGLDLREQERYWAVRFSPSSIFKSPP